MSYDSVILTLELPAAGPDFAATALAAVAGFARLVPAGYVADRSAAAPGTAVRYPGEPPVPALGADALPLQRPAALFATPFEGGPPAWITDAAFPVPGTQPSLQPVAWLWLYAEPDLSAIALTFSLSGFPLADITLSRVEGALVPAPGRAEATGDLARATAALLALDAAFADDPGRYWALDLGARTAYEDATRLDALAARLNRR